MPISSLLQRFVADELARAAALAGHTATLLVEQLKQPREGMLGPNEREHYAALVEGMQRRSADFQRAFADELQAIVGADLAERTQSSGQPGANLGGLQLMDETRVEADIEISRAAQLIDTTAEYELRELQTFTSTLAGQKHVSADSNPLQPLVYARSLWAATEAVTTVFVRRSILLRIGAGILSGQLKYAWAAACTRLESQGVEPGIYRTVVFAPGVGRAPPSFDVTRPGALEDLRSTMPAPASADTAPTPPAHAAARAPAAGPSSPTFERALVKLEELITLQLAKPVAEQSLSTLTLRNLGGSGEPRANLSAQAGDLVDRQIVELLSRLFESLLADSQLPTAIRAALARLQVSALRVALIDPGMLNAHDHPVWMLINRIGEAAATYTQAQDPRAAALAAFCETLVEELVRMPTQDAQAYRRSFARLQAFLMQQLREQQAAAQATIDQLRLAEQREELEAELSQRLAEQMVPIRTSGAIRRFVTGTWAKVLADAIQRFGDKGEPTTSYLKAVDDLLWSLRLPDHPQSRQRLLGLLPALLERLRAGMESIGVAEADRNGILDELMAVHAEALRPGKPAPQPELTALEIVQRMREEEVVDEPQIAPFSDSLIDLGSMDTIPADALDELAPSRDSAPAHRVETMEPGARCRLFIGSGWTRAELLWRGSLGRFMLFAGEAPQRTHSITRRALDRLHDEGLLLPLEDASLVQRAVDRLVRDMAEGR